jgi:hypothetical protein
MIGKLESGQALERGVMRRWRRGAGAGAGDPYGMARGGARMGQGWPASSRAQPWTRHRVGAEHGHRRAPWPRAKGRWVNSMAAMEEEVGGHG